MFDNNFGKSGPIFKILSPLDSYMYTRQTFAPHLQYVVTVSVSCANKKFKNVADFDSIFTKLLTCS